MKKNLLILASAFLLSLSPSFAADTTPVPSLIQKELSREFKNAASITWKTTDKFYKASFLVGTSALEAFFSHEGALIGVSRKIKTEALPISLMEETKELINGNEVVDLFELLSDKGTEYFLTLENSKGKKTFKSNGYSWSKY